jgi:hypothetical protein
MERVGGELGGVELARAEAPELGCNLAHPDPRDVEDWMSAHERDSGAPGGEGSAAPLAVEAGVEHSVTRDRDADTEAVAARRAAGRSGERVSWLVPAALGGLDVMGEAIQVHTREDTDRAERLGVSER